MRLSSSVLALGLLFTSCANSVTPPTPDLPPGVHECPPLPAAGASGDANASPSEWPIPSDRFVLIDFGTHVEGKCVAGKCPAGPMIGSSPPSDLLVDDALRMVFAQYQSDSGTAGSGGGGWLFPVTELPYVREAVTIRAVAADGSVSLSFRGLPIELAANERWECQTVRRERHNDYTTEDRTSISFKNHGALDKQAIQCAEPGRACQIVTS